MLKFIRILIKTILAPFVLLLSLVIWIITKIFTLVAGFAMILSVVFVIFGIWFLFIPSYNWSVIPTLVIAFLLSPLGVPLLGGILIVISENIRDWLKTI